MSTPKHETLPAKASLLDIEVGWLELVQRREDAEEQSAERPACFECGGLGKLLPELVATCGVCDGTVRSKSPRELAIEESDLAIAEHVTREVAKVDGYIGFVRFLQSTVVSAKAERDRQSLRAQRAESILEQVKAGAKYAMEATGRKRIDGQRGHISIVGNGGVLPLVVSDPAFVPDEYCRMEGWVRADLWQRIQETWQRTQERSDWGMDGYDWSLKRVAVNELIRARLAGTCEECEGHSGSDPSEQVCGSCGGSGRAAIPGAYLGERGTHLQVKS